MRQYCDKCKRSYDDDFCDTGCPHRGYGFCSVCDCTICVCEKESSRDWERSSNNREQTA